MMADGRKRGLISRVGRILFGSEDEQGLVRSGSSKKLSMDWEGAKDLDAVAYCYYFDAINPPNYYTGIFQDAGQGLADVSKPEEGTTVVPLPVGADCWFFIVQYSGAPGPYSIEITVLED